MASIGQKIKSARKLAGITQAELAKRTKISRPYIGAVEIDLYNPSVSTLQLIARALQVPTGSLLADEPDTGSIVYNLSADEAHLVDSYRELDVDNRKTVTSMTAFLGNQQSSKTRNKSDIKNNFVAFGGRNSVNQNVSIK